VARVLLEFSTNRVFQLQASDGLSGEINPTALIAQIAAIIIHFPSVRLIWSPSFAFTASIFSRLKQGREQPRLDPATKEPVSVIDPANQARSATTKRAIEFLKACPGITAATLPQILKRVKSVKELVELDEAEIVAVMGKRDGNVFLKFIKHKF
jgi:DNA excision repair protein ERCC-4